eukprot:1157566-Pelagomonas_calceolata.AAC.3
MTKLRPSGTACVFHTWGWAKQLSEVRACACNRREKVPVRVPAGIRIAVMTAARGKQQMETEPLDGQGGARLRMCSEQFQESSTAETGVHELR